MKVVITGGAGFLGKKLARRILEGAELVGPSGRPEKVRELTLFDVAVASGPGLDDPRVHAVAGDIANFATVQTIVQGASTVFHFAAVVSAGAEADFDLGYKVNLDGTFKIVKQSIVAPDCDRYLLENPPAEYERLQTGGAPFLNGITVSSSGDIYLAATGCRCVLKLDPQGRVSTILKAESPWSPTGSRPPSRRPWK